MACLMNVMAILVMAVGSVVSGQVEVAKDDNIEPFSLLWRIYNVAKNPPINHVDLQEPNKIVEEINSLNASLMDQKRLNETEEVWSSVGAKLTPTITREEVLAQLSLNQITQRAHKILEEINKVNVTETIEKAKAEFNKVIFGENGNESDLDHTALSGIKGRADACGKSGLTDKGDSAGNNPVVDFFCLCVQRQDGQGAKQVRVFYVGSIYDNGMLGWNESRTIGSSTMWASIKGGCRKYIQQHPKSTAEARHILDQFLKHLKAGSVYRWCESGSKTTQGSKRKEGMLGAGITIDTTTDVTCDGKNGGIKNKNVAPGGVCVYYGKENWEENNGWLQKFKSALASVNKTNNKAASIQRVIKKLQMLQHRAEYIYETAKVIPEIQHPVGFTTTLQNGSGNLTAYNSTRTRSYSYSSNPLSQRGRCCFFDKSNGRLTFLEKNRGRGCVGFLFLFPLSVSKFVYSSFFSLKEYQHTLKKSKKVKAFHQRGDHGLCFVNAMVVAAAICSHVKYAAAQGAEVKSMDNAEQFALLCRIYNVAKNPSINHVDLPDPLKIVNEINALNTSFTEDKQLNEADQMENSSDYQVQPTITRESAIAQAILKRITQKAHTILDEIKKVNATRNIEKVKAEFAEVIFGDGKNESDLCQGALNGVQERGAACGASGLRSKGDSAGKSIIVDFFCLCVQNPDTNNGIENVCGVKVGGKDEKHSWGKGGPRGCPSMWASIKKECSNLLHHHPKSNAEGYEVLEDFLKHLETGGIYRWGSSTFKGTNLKSGMLGTSVGTDDGGTGSDLICDGKKGYAGKKRGPKESPPGGVCVYYGTKNEWKNIPWLMKLKSALNKVDTINNQTASIQRAIEKLQMLQHRAEEIYETAKMISEIQNPVVLTAFQNVSGNMTAYNATRTRSYSYGTHPYLIPAWALFLI
ncbi:Variant surface glycoprotein [Trypanosoma congolense IL3000]|uniref:Variant surface glycoprotein n=1 Tax=Trypanosoma congolense (strain IL3000) TaxID=1068625 RepID=F9WGE1_TRYCI|nr:Variant surface glycoprotein [Trypanosoma congolense IL3000]